MTFKHVLNHIYKTGADVVKNDGIYSKYFTEYAGRLFSFDSNRQVQVYNTDIYCLT